MLEEIEEGEKIEDLKMNVLQAIRFIIKSWEEITPETLHNCWRHTNILPASINAELSNMSDNIRTANDSTLNDLSEALTTLNLSDKMQVEEFLNIPEENIVYEVPEDDKIIEELAEIYKKRMDIPSDGFVDDDDDSNEQPIIRSKEALKGLETVHTFLLQQENASEQLKLVNKIEKYINVKKENSSQQTKIDNYLIHN
jgi:hypothetical protein